MKTLDLSVVETKEFGNIYFQYRSDAEMFDPGNANATDIQIIIYEDIDECREDLYKKRLIQSAYLSAILKQMIALQAKWNNAWLIFTNIWKNLCFYPNELN